MKSDRLWPLDRECLLEEDDPEVLHRCARGLLRHFRAIRAARPRGHKRGLTKQEAVAAGGYSLRMIAKAAAELRAQYSDVGVSPPPELALLDRELRSVRPNPRASTAPVRSASLEAYWSAVYFDAAQPPDPSGKNPSSASCYAVAKHALPLFREPKKKSSDDETEPWRKAQRDAEREVKVWRKKEHYRANVVLHRRQKNLLVR